MLAVVHPVSQYVKLHSITEQSLPVKPVTHLLHINGDAQVVAQFLTHFGVQFAPS